jgi:MFS family permease
VWRAKHPIPINTDQGIGSSEHACQNASAILNSTLIAVALVPIGLTFGAGPGQTAWLISALYLATAVGQPVVGLFVDRFGARRVLLPGAAVVLAAGIAGMFPISVGWLIGVRVVLGIGTCAGFPAAMAVLRHDAVATGQVCPPACCRSCRSRRRPSW